MFLFSYCIGIGGLCLGKERPVSWDLPILGRSFQAVSTKIPLRFLKDKLVF